MIVIHLTITTFLFTVYQQIVAIERCFFAELNDGEKHIEIVSNARAPVADWYIRASDQIVEEVRILAGSQCLFRQIVAC